MLDSVDFGFREMTDRAQGLRTGKDRCGFHGHVHRRAYGFRSRSERNDSMIFQQDHARQFPVPGSELFYARPDSPGQDQSRILLGEQKRDRPATNHLIRALAALGEHLRLARTKDLI